VSASTGAATVNGSVSCNNNSYITISGQIKQTKGGVPINGFFSAFVPCNTTTVRWSAACNLKLSSSWEVRAALHGGKASITGVAYGFAPDTGEFKQVNISSTVTLRGAQ